MKRFLEAKIKNKEKERESWTKKRNNATDEMQVEIDRLKKLKVQNMKVLQEMKEK